MKKILEILFLTFILVMVYIYQENITSFIIDIIYKKEPYITHPNNYTVHEDFYYVKKTDDFFANNPQEILNIFYTYLNNGEEEFHFYCDYDECQKDISRLNYENILVNINNFVHPFHTYKRLYIIPTNWGKISVKVEKTYTQNEIKELNNKMVDIINEVTNNNMNTKQKIKAYHDYIINNTKYDIEYIQSEIKDINSPSHKANGPLIYSKALCGGYAHAMSLFLATLKIPNYRIASDTHIWNLVYIDNKWYHLDLTWDDPVTSNKTDILLHDYFLISTETLEKLDTQRHIFDKNIYKETIQTN